MSWSTQVFPTGALKDRDFVGDVNWDSLDEYLNDKESADDCALLKFSIDDVHSSLALSLAIENKDNLNVPAEWEDIKLQKLYLHEYLESCYFIKFDSCSSQLIEGCMLGNERFPALSKDNISAYVHFRICQLRRLNSIHNFYAFRKGLAKYELIKWDDDFEEISEQLNCENGWSELSASDLQNGFYQNLFILNELNDMKASDPVAATYIPKILRSKLLAEINREYIEELHKFAKECDQERIKFYHERRNLVNLLRKRAVEAQVARVKYFPKEYQLGAECWPQSIQEYQWSVKSRFKPWLLEKLSQFKDRGGNRRLGGSFNALSGIVLSGALVVAFVRGKLKQA